MGKTLTIHAVGEAVGKQAPSHILLLGRQKLNNPSEGDWEKSNKMAYAFTLPPSNPTSRSLP